MSDDLIYTYVVSQYDVVKKCFLSKCKTDVDQFISRNENYLKHRLSFMISPYKSYEEKVMLQSVCECDDIHKISLYFWRSEERENIPNL